MQGLIGTASGEQASGSTSRSRRQAFKAASNSAGFSLMFVVQIRFGEADDHSNSQSGGPDVFLPNSVALAATKVAPAICAGCRRSTKITRQPLRNWRSSRRVMKKHFA